MKMIGIARQTIHAPRVNFVSSTMTSTVPVRIAPVMLIDWLRRIRRRC